MTKITGYLKQVPRGATHLFLYILQNNRYIFLKWELYIRTGGIKFALDFKKRDG
jgi:hypothetical protein